MIIIKLTVPNDQHCERFPGFTLKKGRYWLRSRGAYESLMTKKQSDGYFTGN